jgi:LPXTG-motif cell wall-anchored protein
MESQHKLGADSLRARASHVTKTAAGRRPMARRMRQVALTAGVAALGLSLISGPAAMAETIDEPAAVTSTDAAEVSNDTAASAAEVSPAAEVAPAAAAKTSAADAQVDSVTITEDAQYDNGAVNVNFGLAVPDTAKAGDTFTLTYPSLLRYDNSKEAIITLEDGTVLARGALTDAANRTITFTFTDVVDTHRNITVKGYVGMIIDDPAANNTSKDFVFVQAGKSFTDAVITMPAQRPPLTSVFISGEWNAEDRGRDVPKGAITWTANLPEGQWTGQTVSVKPSDATSLLDCSAVSFYTTEVPDGAIYHSSVLDENQVSDGTDPSYADVVSCSPTELVVKYIEPVATNFVRQVKIVADAADTDVTSQFGASVINSDLILAAGDASIVPTNWYNFVARDVAAGEGDGEVRNAVIAISKYSAAEGSIDGDFDSAPGKALVAGQSEAINFDITNTGTEALTGIKLVDQTLSGVPVALAECALDQVVLQPGETVSCTGTLLPTTSGMYADNATVTAVSVRDAAAVTASDAWYGSVPAPAVIVPTVPTPVAPVVVPATLASTGMDASGLPIYLGGSLLLVLAGAAVFFVNRRRTVTED